jgi:uncharacterized membrane protein
LPIKTLIPNLQDRLKEGLDMSVHTKVEVTDKRKYTSVGWVHQLFVGSTLWWLSSCAFVILCIWWNRTRPFVLLLLKERKRKKKMFKARENYRNVRNFANGVNANMTYHQVTSRYGGNAPSGFP